jgi:hypothetical protein
LRPCNIIQCQIFSMLPVVTGHSFLSCRMKHNLAFPSLIIHHALPLPFGPFNSPSPPLPPPLCPFVNITLLLRHYLAHMPLVYQASDREHCLNFALALVVLNFLLG